MKALFPDWRAQGVTVCLHEHQGGFAFNLESVLGLRDKCLAEGVPILARHRGDRLRARRRRHRRRRRDEPGPIEVGEQVVDRARARGRKRFWAMLGLPDDDRHPHAVGRRRPRPADVDVLEPPGGRDHGRPADVRDRRRRRAAGDPPRHRRAAATPTTGELVTDELWGIYYKRDRHGVQGGASPLTVDGDVELDPYPSTTDVDPSFPDMWCAALSHAMSRFEGCRALYKQARSGGVGAFTADNFPVFD